MRRTLATLATLALLLGAACGGNDDNDVKSQDSDGTTTTVAAETSTTAVAAATATTAAGGKTATTARTATTTPRPATPGSGVPTPAAPGTYEYAQSGTSSTGSIPPTGLLKVDPANANGVQVWHRQVDPAQPGSDTTIAFTSTGPFITDVVQRQQQFEVKCHFDPAIPAPPWPPAEGKPITGKANCGQIQVEVSGSVTGKRTAKLDGADIEVIVATVTIKTTGQIESTNTETQWYSPALRLTVHSESKTNGRFGAFPFQSNVTSDLKSGKPKP